MLNPYTSTLVAAGTASDGISLEDDYDFSTRGRRGIVSFHNVTAIGNGRSYVDSAAIAFPVVVDVTHNQFGYGGATTHDFVLPSGSYADINALVAAFATITNDEDNVGGIFSTLVTVSAKDATHLRFTSVPTGVNVLAFSTGVENDVLAKLGITNGWTIAHTGAAGADGTYSATITLQGKDEESGSFYDILVGAAQTDVSDKVLQAHPFMAAVANLTATSQLTDHLRIKLVRTTTNVITRSLAFQLTA